MRYLLLILAIPLLAQAQPDSKECVRLRSVASDLEKMVQKKYVGDKCSELPASEFENFDYRCKDLSSIEMQLKSLENEIAMINGVKNLRNEVLAAKETLEKNPNKGVAQDASQLLYKNLKIASQIEGYLGATGIKGENLLTVLAKAPDEDLRDAKKFAALVAATCVKIGVLPGNSVACDKPTEVSEDVLAEVNGLLLLGKKTERKFNKSQVEDLKKAMAIKNGESDFSFTEMLKVVGDPGTGAFSQKDVATFSTLNLAPDADKFAFLKNIRSASKNLASTVDLTAAQEVPARFKTFITDLKNREEWEMKSKISVVLNELKDGIPESAKAACNSARELTGELDDCLGAIAKNTKIESFRRGSAANILLELQVGQFHIQKLDQVLAKCVPDDQMNLSDDCNAYTDAALLTLTKKAAELNVIKAKILESSSGLLLTRDLAIETLYNQQCLSSAQSDINGCAADIGTISREAIALSDTAGEIVYMYNKPAVVTDIDKICKEIPQGTTHSAEICKIALTKPASDTPVARKKNDRFMASTAPVNGRNTSQETLSGILGSLAQTAGSFFMPQQQMINPYANMYPYTPNVGQPQGNPYTVMGFGNYSPTPGLRPYSSVNSNVGTASAYNFGSSGFFNSPVGW